MVVHACNEMLFSVQKGMRHQATKDLEETSKHMTVNAANLKRLCDSKHATFCKGKSMKTVKDRVVCRELGGRSWRDDRKEHRRLLAPETTLYDNYE